jgi:hypothetical protein
VQAASVKTWAFGIVAGALLAVLLLVGLLTLRSHRRRANQCVPCTPLHCEPPGLDAWLSKVPSGSTPWRATMNEGAASRCCRRCCCFDMRARTRSIPSAADAAWSPAVRRYKAWKEAGLSQALDADLPVSTGAVWGLQKNTWSSQCASAFHAASHW